MGQWVSFCQRLDLRGDSGFEIRQKGQRFPVFDGLVWSNESRISNLDYLASSKSIGPEGVTRIASDIVLTRCPLSCPCSHRFAHLVLRLPQ
jgi:hypothetical protein